MNCYRTLQHGLLLAWMLISHVCLADNLMNSVEYQVSATDLKTFSGTALSVALCDDCKAQSFSLTSTTELQEYQQTIDLQRASELYLRKTPAIIFIGVDRAANTINYVNFGGHASSQY